MKHIDAAALAAFQDGGLSRGERASAVSHLVECAECRNRLGAQTRAAAGREGGWPAGAGVAGTIPPSRRFRYNLLAAAAIGALLVGVGLWWSERVAPEREPSVPDRAAVPGARQAPAGSPEIRSPASGELAGGEQDRLPEDSAAEPVPEEGVEPELLALRAGVREVDGKTFRLEGDEWVDDAWTAPPGRAPLALVRDTDVWRAALAERPALARYAEVGPRVLVVLDSLAFRILPAP